MRSETITKMAAQGVTVYYAYDGKSFTDCMECASYEKKYYANKIKDIPKLEAIPPRCDTGPEHTWYYVTSAEQIAMVENYHNVSVDRNSDQAKYDLVNFEITELKQPTWICVLEDDGSLYDQGTLDDYKHEVEDFLNRFQVPSTHEQDV